MEIKLDIEFIWTIPVQSAAKIIWLNNITLYMYVLYLRSSHV